MTKKLLFIIFITLFSISVVAGEYGGKVKALYVDHHGRVLINIDGGSVKPNCAEALWQFNFRMTDPGAKEWFSMLLATRATNTTIRLGYVDNPTGECSVVYFFYVD